MNHTAPKWWLLGPILAILGAPLVGFAIALPANEYAAVLDVHAFDCDGPIVVLLFLVPGTFFALGGLGVNAWSARTGPAPKVSLVSAIFGLLLVVAVERKFLR